VTSLSAQPSDGQVIAAVLAGQSERFAVLVRKYESALFRTALSRLGQRDWAEDAVQETFYCAFKSLASYNSLYSFRTWLWTILLNQCRRRYHNERRRPESQYNGDAIPAGAGRCFAQEAGGAAAAKTLAIPCSRPQPPADAIAREQSERLARLLSELPESQADAVRLRFHGGLTFPEIAAALGCSLSSAKNWVRLGLLGIAQQLPEDLFACEPASQEALKERP
jgi:RNA polymerase sigma-70 factor (ECF subfamily)